MSLEDAYFISQIIAAAAIVASLIFVGLQLRQSDKTQRALVHQARADRLIDHAKAMRDPVAQEATIKAMTGRAEFTDADFLSQMGIVRSNVHILDDTHWQYKAGLLDEAAWRTAVAMSKFFFAVPANRALWNISKATFAPELVALVDRAAIDGVPLSPPMSPAAMWKAALARLTE
jgi:hypothetical protein